MDTVYIEWGDGHVSHILAEYCMFEHEGCFTPICGRRHFFYSYHFPIRIMLQPKHRVCVDCASDHSVGNQKFRFPCLWDACAYTIVVKAAENRREWIIRTKFGKNAE